MTLDGHALWKDHSVQVLTNEKMRCSGGSGRQSRMSNRAGVCGRREAGLTSASA